MKSDDAEAGRSRAPVGGWDRQSDEISEWVVPGHTFVGQANLESQVEPKPTRMVRQSGAKEATTNGHE